jgi:hypothetical protein
MAEQKIPLFEIVENYPLNATELKCFGENKSKFVVRYYDEDNRYCHYFVPISSSFSGQMDNVVMHIREHTVPYDNHGPVPFNEIGERNHNIYDWNIPVVIRSDNLSNASVVNAIRETYIRIDTEEDELMDYGEDNKDDDCEDDDCEDDDY